MIWHLGYGTLAGYWYQIEDLQSATEAMAVLTAAGDEIANQLGASSDEEALKESDLSNIDWISAQMPPKV